MHRRPTAGGVELPVQRIVVAKKELFVRDDDRDDISDCLTREERRYRGGFRCRAAHLQQPPCVFQPNVDAISG